MTVSIKQKTRAEIIEETYDYYVPDPSKRGLNKHGGCEYLTNDGKMCAVGRCMLNPEKHSTPKRKISTPICDIEDIDSELKLDYRGHHTDFWEDLQNWHDGQSNWNKFGVTKKGQKKFDELKEKWC